MPDDVFGAPAAPSVDDDVDLIVGDASDASASDDDAPEEDDSDATASDKDKEDEDEEKIEEDEDKKPEIPFDRPTIKDLKEAYPDIFKKFPSLRDSYFREIEFTKLFPSVEDAKDAITDNEAFSSLSDAALNGDPEPIIESLDKTDKKALTLFAAGFLPALYKNDKEIYHQIITPVVENLFRNAYKSSDEEVRKAAVVIAKFIFDEDGEAIAQGKKTVSNISELTKEQKRLQQERNTRTAAAFHEAYTDVSQRITANLETMIVKDIDPNKVYSPFVRKQLAKEAVKLVFKQLEADEGHKSVMSNRWKKAKSDNYSSDHRSKIVSTFLARAKSLIPSASEKVRSLAAGSSRREAPEKPVRHEVNGGRPSGRSPATKSRADLRKMTDMEILEM